MRSTGLLPLLALAAGCNSEPSVQATNASVEDVQKQVAQAGGRMEMRPGRWEGNVSVKNAAPAGVPAAASANTSRAIKICVTADQAKAEANPIVAQIQQGCKYDTFKLADGKVDAKMTCTRPGLTLKSELSGELTANRYKLTNVTVASGEATGPMSGMKAESVIDARRTGECRGDEDKSTRRTGEPL